MNKVVLLAVVAVIVAALAGCAGGTSEGPASTQWAAFSVSRQPFCLRAENVFPLEGAVELRLGEVAFISASWDAGAYQLARLPESDKGLGTRLSGSGTSDGVGGVGLYVWAEVAGDYELRLTATSGEIAIARVHVSCENAPVTVAVRQNGLLVVAQELASGWPPYISPGQPKNVRVSWPVGATPAILCTEHPDMLGAVLVDSAPTWAEYQLAAQPGSENTGQVVHVASEGGDLKLFFAVF